MYFKTSLEVVVRISYEFAHHQWGDPGNTGMYSFFPMKCKQPPTQPPIFFVCIRQVSSGASYL